MENPTSVPEVKPVNFDAPIEPGAQINPTPLNLPKDVMQPPTVTKPVETVVEEKKEEQEPVTNDQLNLVRELIEEPDLHVNQLAVTKREFQYIYDRLSKFYMKKNEDGNDVVDDAAVAAAKNDPTSIFSLVMNAMSRGWGSNQLQSYLDVLTQNDTYKKLIASSDKSLGSFGDGRTSKLNTSVDVSGEEARNAFSAALSGLIRVKLLNSGFWVALRRPLMHELQELYDIVDLESKDIGYSIGAHFALIADMYIKMRFCQALVKYRIIVDSNLTDIYKGNTFIKALSFHDYEVLLHAALSLMAKHKDRGLRCRLVCPSCGHAEINEKIDVKSAKFYNRDLLSKPELQQWWAKKSNGQPVKYTADECRKYQEEILGYSKVFDEDFDAATIRTTLRVPTMLQYFDAGEILVDRIRKVIDEQSEDDEERRQIVMANLAAHTYQMIVPWVKKIEKLEDGEVTLRTKDIETIINVFDPTNQQSNHDPMGQFAKFLSESKITWIGTYALECPNCHAKPDVGLDQFYPLEVQTIFFGLLFRQLPLEIMQAAAGN